MTLVTTRFQRRYITKCVCWAREIPWTQKIRDIFSNGSRQIHVLCSDPFLATSSRICLLSASEHKIGTMCFVRPRFLWFLAVVRVTQLKRNSYLKITSPLLTNNKLNVTSHITSCPRQKCRVAHCTRLVLFLVQWTQDTQGADVTRFHKQRKNEQYTAGFTKRTNFKISCHFSVTRRGSKASARQQHLPAVASSDFNFRSISAFFLMETICCAQWRMKVT